MSKMAESSSSSASASSSSSRRIIVCVTLPGKDVVQVHGKFRPDAVNTYASLLKQIRAIAHSVGNANSQLVVSYHDYDNTQFLLQTEEAYADYLEEYKDHAYPLIDVHVSATAAAVKSTSAKPAPKAKAAHVSASAASAAAPAAQVVHATPIKVTQTTNALPVDTTVGRSAEVAEVAAATETDVCRHFNRRHMGCRFGAVQCRQRHVCIKCGGAHPIFQCAGNKPDGYVAPTRSWHRTCVAFNRGETCPHDYDECPDMHVCCVCGGDHPLRDEDGERECDKDVERLKRLACKTCGIKGIPGAIVLADHEASDEHQANAKLATANAVAVSSSASSSSASAAAVPVLASVDSAAQAAAPNDGQPADKREKPKAAEVVANKADA